MSRVPRVVALDKRELAKSIARDRRETLKRLRARVREARASKRAALAAASAQCRAGRDRAAAARAKAKEAIALARAARLEARSSCEVPAGVAALTDAVRAARVELAREEEAARTLREAERMARSRTSKEPRSSARERRSESDDEVRANIPPELASLFERVKRSIKGSARKSRTEEFLEYVEEHPEEAFAGIDDETDRLIAEREAELRRAAEREEARKEAFAGIDDETDRLIAEREAELRRAAEREEARNRPSKGRTPRWPRKWNDYSGISEASRSSPGLVWDPSTGFVLQDGRIVGHLQRTSAKSFTARRAGSDTMSLKTNEADALEYIRIGAFYAHQAEKSARARKANPRIVAPLSPKLKGEALRDYVRKHWGHKGEFTEKQAVVVDPTHGALVIMGRLERVVYSTRKGGEDQGKLTDYDHAFEDARPWLAFHVCELGKKCPGHGKLVIAGGSYRTETRGIVG